MPLFSNNKTNQNDGTLNANNGANTGPTMRQNEYDQEPNRSDYAYDNNNVPSGTGPQTGGMYNNGRGQGYNETGNEFGETRAERRAERAEEMPVGGQTGGHHPHHHDARVNPSANPNTGVGAGTYGGTGAGTGVGGSGGFISQSHSDQLGRDADVRRQERGNQFGSGGGGGVGNTAEYNAMGFDSPPSNTNTNNFGSSGNNNSNMTSPTGTGTGTGAATGGMPHNSMSLKEQAEQKARESEAMQKQAIEVGKAEQLEKQAMAARQRAVEHGAHPLHGQIGGLNSGRGNSQA